MSIDRLVNNFTKICTSVTQVSLYSDKKFLPCFDCSTKGVRIVVKRVRVEIKIICLAIMRILWSHVMYSDMPQEVNLWFRIQEDWKTVASNFLKVSYYAFEGNKPKMIWNLSQNEILSIKQSLMSDPH